MSIKSLINGAVFSSSTNPLAWSNFLHLPRFLRDLKNFRSLGASAKLELFPILSEFEDSAGVMSGHYFHQDLFVARKIFKAQPDKHFDIGSRIDGFVAHVASFMSIDIFDVRHMESKVPGINFVQADFMMKQSVDERVASLSCLHTLEHFGLGRYGDSIDPSGHLRGFENLVDLLDPDGVLYLSFPISNRERVEFNAHRVFHPMSVLSWSGSEKLALEDFSWVDDHGDFHESSSIDEALLANLNYGCGIYIFRKSSHS